MSLDTPHNCPQTPVPASPVSPASAGASVSAAIALVDDYASFLWAHRFGCSFGAKQAARALRWDGLCSQTKDEFRAYARAILNRETMR